MPRQVKGLRWLPRPVERRLAELDLREHQDKILLLLALVISAIVGLVVVAFLAMTERMGKLMVSAGPMQRLLSPLLGSLVGGWLLFRFFPDARGSGIPQTRVALLLQKGYISLRTVIGKFICSSISLGSGVALGREGPSVQIGAGIASFAGRRLGLSDEHIRSLIPVGTAAAVAAAFNTPLAAVLFTLEEILADLHARVVGSVVIGAATSWIVLRLILGDEPLFHVPSYQLVHPLEFLVYAILGVLGGLVSTAFVKLLLWQRTVFFKTPLWAKPFAPAAGGLTVGLLALAVPGVIGVGYNLVSEALNGQLALRMMLLLLVLKLIATATSYSSGNAGGIFGPSLFIGAMLGGAVGHVAHAIAPEHTASAGAYALVGMGAAFAGIVRTPMTSVIMIFEVTRDYTIIVPLMIANLCSYLLAQKLQHLPIYEALSRQDGIFMPSAAHRLEPLTVEQAMRAGTQAPDRVAMLHVYPDDPLDTALQRMGAAGVDEIQVISRAGAMPAGTLRREDAVAAYQNSAAEAQVQPAESVRNWLPATAVITAAAILLVSTLVFWQRSHSVERAMEQYRSGRQLLADGREDDAVAAFRSALAGVPQDNQVRAALGLALVRTGNYAEAESYLLPVARVEPQNGPVWLGLAEAARARGEQARALDWYRQAMVKEWPPDAAGERRAATLDYAALLAGAGRSAEANSLLEALIAQRGDDPVLSKKAAAMIQANGSPEQIEEAYTTLANHFPADASVWMALGNARLAAAKDGPALEAFRRAAQIDAQDSVAAVAVARVEQMMDLDPTRRGLSVRERARRWDGILQRVVDASAQCGANPEAVKAGPLLKKPATSLDASDRKMEASLLIWKATPESCRSDVVLAHIMSKVTE